MAEETVLVIGGGIAGMTAALELANQGLQVILVEKEPFLGGWTSSFCCKATDVCTGCSSCLVVSKLNEVAAHERISVLTGSVVRKVEGEVGNFKVGVYQKPRYIDPNRCIACGICADICPADPKALRSPSNEAFPYSYVLDEKGCLYFGEKGCELCQERCPTDAINLEVEPKEEDFFASAIIVATGFDVFDAGEKAGFGYGRLPNVLTGIDLERIFNQEGNLRVLSNSSGQPSIAFIQCVGSRDSLRSYCSQVCCKYAMRFALLIKHHNALASVTIFYIDLQNAGKGFAQFYEQCREKIRFIRGLPVEVLESHSGRLEVKFENIPEGKIERELFDMVVLSVGMVPRKDCWDLAQKLRTNLGEYGFFDTPGPSDSNRTNVKGIFVAGACQGPKDIADSIAHAICAAREAMEVLKTCQRI